MRSNARWNRFLRVSHHYILIVTKRFMKAPLFFNPLMRSNAMLTSFLRAFSPLSLKIHGVVFEDSAFLFYPLMRSNAKWNLSSHHCLLKLTRRSTSLKVFLWRFWAIIVSNVKCDALFLSDEIKKRCFMVSQAIRKEAHALVYELIKKSFHIKARVSH